MSEWVQLLTVTVACFFPFLGSPATVGRAVGARRECTPWEAP